MVSKALRQTVYDKFNGKCAFCGDILEQGWHIWDVVPVMMVIGDYEEEQKCLPACKSCGGVRLKNKGNKMNIEDFREEITHMYEFVKNFSMYGSSVRRALKFGIINELDSRIKFHFEKQ